MDEKTTSLQEVGAAFRDQGFTAAITALIGGTIVLLAAVTRKAFTNDAMLARLDRELEAERSRADRQRAEDRNDDANRLERIETVIRSSIRRGRANRLRSLGRRISRSKPIPKAPACPARVVWASRCSTASSW